MAHGLLRILILLLHSILPLDEPVSLCHMVQEQYPVVHIFKTLMVFIPLYHRNRLDQSIPLHALPQISIIFYAVRLQPFIPFISRNISVQEIPISIAGSAIIAPSQSTRNNSSWSESSQLL